MLTLGSWSVVPTTSWVPSERTRTSGATERSSLPWGKERQEAGGGGRGEEALGATASVVGYRRGPRTALQRASARTTGGRLETNDGAGKKKLKRRWCSQHRRDDPKVARRARLLSPDRASDLKVTAQLRTWSIPKEERPLRRLQHLISPRRRISSYAPSHRRECWLTKSADRSIARRAPSCCARPRSGAATSAGSSDL
jgi:hypothetical protein